MEENKPQQTQQMRPIQAGQKKGFGKKLWNFLWHSNSVWSWIVDLLIIFVIIKFVIFPVLSLAMATPMPFVIVESQSMHHEGSFDAWWTSHGAWYADKNFTGEQVKSWSLMNGFSKGDIMIIKGYSNKSKIYSIGDIIVFRVNGQKTPIIHRVISISACSTGTCYETKGDHNDGQLVYEKSVSQQQVLGKAVGKVPWFGWIKLVFVQGIR